MNIEDGKDFIADWEGFKKHISGHDNLPDSLFKNEKAIFIPAYLAGYFRAHKNSKTVLDSELLDQEQK